MRKFFKIQARAATFGSGRANIHPSLPNGQSAICFVSENRGSPNQTLPETVQSRFRSPPGRGLPDINDRPMVALCCAKVVQTYHIHGAEEESYFLHVLKALWLMCYRNAVKILVLCQCAGSRQSPFFVTRIYNRQRRPTLTDGPFRNHGFKKQHSTMMILSSQMMRGWAFVFCFSLCAFADDAVSLGGDTSRQSAAPVTLAHYMPWYSAKPFSDHWGWHWTMNHFDPEQEIDGQRQIASKYYPLIWPYDSGDPDVLEYHLLLMKLSGIDGVIVDWYGLTDFRDYAILHRNTTRLLQQCERLKMKFVICYEDQTIPALVESNRITAAGRVTHAVSEIDWLGRYWFKSGSYMKLDGKPVLLSFGHSGLTREEWTQCLSQLASPIAYFSQDIQREGAIGAFGWPAPRVGMVQVDRFLTESANWPEAIPAAFPRFDDIYKDAGVGEGYPQLPDDSGRTLQLTLQKALNSNSRIIQIATWNDWGEGTQIEPSVEFGFRDLKIIQKVLRNSGKKDFLSDDLQLPYRLLEARRAGAETRTLDAIATSISSGDIEAAQRRLADLMGQ